MPAVRAGSAKWKLRTAGAAQDYAAGARNPRVPWAQATAAAEGNWTQGVQEAASRGAFAKGVQQAGDAAWQQGVQTKGVARFAQGVQQSGDNYDKGFAPYRQVIESTTLPARGPRGSAQNYARAQAMGEALNNAKKQRQGG